MVAGKIPRFWADLQIECLDIILTTYYPRHTVTNFQKSYFRRAQRIPAEKTSEYGLNEYSVQNEKLDCAYIQKSVLIIDYNWHGFGGIRDRFDLIKLSSKIANINELVRMTR